MDKDLEKKVDECLEKITAIVMEINTIKEEIRKIKEGEHATGMYIDGCDDFVRDYLLNDKKGVEK